MACGYDLFHRTRTYGIRRYVVIAQPDDQSAAREIPGKQFVYPSSDKVHKRFTALGGKQPAFAGVYIDVRARLFPRKLFALAFFDVHRGHGKSVVLLLLGDYPVLFPFFGVYFMRFKRKVSPYSVHRCFLRIFGFAPPSVPVSGFSVYLFI